MGDGEKLADVQKTPLTSRGVKDGDELSWRFCDGEDLITVKIVSEKNASEVRTVKLGKDSHFGNLKGCLQRATNEHGTFVFMSNGCTVSSISENKKSPLREALKLKEGDVISWRAEQKGQKRHREADEDTKMSSPPKKRQRRK